MNDTIKITNLAKIKLGKSTENKKEYILEFEKKNTMVSLEINEILTYPFCSTNMRFQYPDMFKYNIEHIHCNLYKLIVTRHEIPNCPVTMIFFPKLGWTIDLEISIKLKYKKNFIFTPNDILYMIPNNYGTVLAPDYFQFKRNGIIIPLFGRFEYTKKCLESLSLTNLSDCTLILVDESVTKNVNDDKIKTKQFIEHFYIDNVDIIKIFKNTHGNMYDSILTGLDILGQYCDTLMTLDSDTLHKSYFVDATLNLYNKLLQQNKNILISGFNTLNHAITDVKNNETDNINFNLKKTIGGCHLCFSSNVYNEMLRFGMVSKKWDTHAYYLINKHNGIIATTLPSVIDHIGEISSVRRGGQYDKAYDFEL